MKNAYEVLRQKELELSIVESEVEALRVVAPLLADDLADDNEGSDDNKVAAAGSIVQSRSTWMPQAVNSSPQPADASQWNDRAKNKA